MGQILHRLQLRAAAQIGVDHVALDRSGPDDGDLDDEIVGLPRLRGSIDIWARLSIWKVPSVSAFRIIA